ncbi:MAG: hypothetical protein A3F78_14010 [Burkholderiales bacterium RIFCSPLOWO2_12_FULL_61_40]|nr:MAG: hypothetical protein A3F78_14010 [Burkholderiales bacterium RIFCSPLOWO2_12_FULL_61_40]
MPVQNQIGSNPSPAFLKFALAALAAGSVAYFALLRGMTPNFDFHWLVPALGVLISVGGGVLVWLGRLVGAVRVLVWGAWLLVTVLALFWGGVRTSVGVAYPVIILLAGWLLDVRWALVMSALTLGAAGALGVAEVVGVLPTLVYPSAAFSSVVAYVLMLALSSAAVCLLLRSFHDRRCDLHTSSASEAHRAAELALAETNVRLQTIFEHNPDAMMISRFADGQITDVNQACVRMFGYTREEVIGKTTLELGIWVHLQDRQAMVEPLRTQGYCENVESEFRLKDGSTCVASLTAVLVPLQGVPHIINTLRDITARKWAEDQLQASEALLRTTMESIDEGVLLVSQSGAVLGFNQRFATLWRVPQEIAQTRQDGALLAHVLDQLLEPEQFAATVQSLYNSQDEAHDTLRFKDGRVFTRYTRALLVREQPGRIWCFKDITQRKQTEDQLVESRALLKTLTHAIPDLVWLKDPEGVYLACNQRFEQFFGAVEEDIVGKTDYDFVEPELADFFRKHDKLAMSRGKASVNEEWVGFASDGHRELLETTKTAIFDGQSRLIGVLGIGHDITDRKHAENELRLFASVFLHAREAIMITDPQGSIVEVNDAFTRITGYERAEVQGLNPRILNSGHQRSDFFAGMWRDLNAQGYWYGEVWNRRKNGEVFAVMQTISAVKDAHGQLQHYVALFSDITAIKENEKKLEHIAHYDALTSLPNRVLLADRLQQALARSQRREQLVAVAYLDLDGFKAINDNFGHDAGDYLLAALAARMRLSLREGDTLARLGGDEFVAVLLDLVDVGSTDPLLLRLLAAAAHPVEFGERILQVSASLGVTFFPQSGEVDSDQLLRQADQAMYRAKMAGKNCYHVFDTA